MAPATTKSDSRVGIMKLIIHIGTPKTGTTSIQKGLAMMRENLENASCNYPDENDDCHNILEALVCDYDRLHRVYKSQYKNTPAQAYTDAFNLKERIVKASGKYEYTIISGEYLLSLKKNEIENLIDEFGFKLKDITVVCYVRKPSDFWLSSIQQTIKASTTFDNPLIQKYPFMKGLQTWLNVIPKKNIIVRPFIRTELKGSDILFDFVDNVLCEQIGIDLKDIELPTIISNKSVAAEASILMQELRLEKLDAEDNTFTKESKQLTNAIIRNARIMDLTKMKFDDDISTAINLAHATELDWLKNTFNIVFPGVDGELNEDQLTIVKSKVESIKIRNLLSEYDNKLINKLKNRVFRALEKNK